MPRPLHHRFLARAAVLLLALVLGGGESRGGEAAGSSEAHPSRCGVAAGLPALPFPLAVRAARAGLALPAGGFEWSTGHKRVLFIRPVFPDAPESPLSAEEASRLFSAVQEFYTANSRGRLEFEFVLTPPVMLPEPTGAYRGAGENGKFKLRLDALESVRALGRPELDPAQFDFDCVRHVTVFPQFFGTANIGEPGCWLQTSDVSVVCHELGHNLGFAHANGWAPSAPEDLTNGATLEYANPADPMGSGTVPAGHFGADRKRQLGWLDAGQVRRVTSNGVFRLTAHDTTAPRHDSPLILEVPRANGTPLQLELRSRQPQLHGPPHGVEIFFRGALVDTTPRSDSLASLDHFDARLEPGRIFNDATGQIRILTSERLESDPDSVDVTVRLGTPTGLALPEIAISPGNIQAQPREPIAFEALVRSGSDGPVSVSWDFGDGQWLYGSTVVKTWDSPGEYLVQAQAVDLDGATRSVWGSVRLGNPRIRHTVSGRVTYQGSPIEGARLSVAGQQGFTDKDGRYAVVAVPDGSQVLTLVHSLAPLGRKRTLLMAGAPLTDVDFALTGPSIIETRLTNPTANGSFPANRPVRMYAVLTLEAGATMASVEYRIGDRLVATATAPATAATWFPPTAGTHQLVAIGIDAAGNRAESEPVNFEVYDGPPANDDIAGRIAFDGPFSTIRGHNLRATREAGEEGKGDASVWFDWSSPATGLIQMQADLDEGGQLDVRAFLLETDGTRTPVSGEVDGVARYSTTPGRHYAIRVAGSPESTGPFLLKTDLRPAPVDDAFERRSVLPAPTVPIRSFSSNAGASTEPGEPAHGGPRAGVSTWRTIRVNTAGTVQAGTDRPGVHLALYRGHTLESLVPAGTAGPTIVWFAEAGTEYLLAIVTAPGDLAPYALTVAPATVALNDSLATAHSPDGGQWTANASTGGATREQAEPDLLPEVPNPAVVWWTWLAQVPGSMAVKVSPAINGTVVGIAVHSRGPEGSLSELARGRILSTGALATFDAVAGTTYAIAVAAPAGIRYSLELRSKFGNDYFDDATPYPAGAVFVEGTTAGASFESGEPGGAIDFPIRTVWWAWVAPQSVWMRATVFAMPGTPRLDVFAGTNLKSLREQSIGSVANGPETQALFSAVAGRSYYFRIYESQGRAMPYRLMVYPEGAPAPASNDDFAHALPFASPTVDTLAQLSTATIEPGEPVHASGPLGASVWYEWTAPNSGGRWIQVTGKESRVVAYTGSSLANLVRQTPPDTLFNGNRRTSLRAAAGTVYRIAVAGPGNVPASARLTLLPAPPNDDFARRRRIVGESIDLSGDSLGATLEPGEPAHSELPFGASVWFSWTAPGDGWFQLECAAAPRVAVYTGADLANLRAQTHSDSGRVVFQALSGAVYSFVVCDVEGTGTEFRLHLAQTSLPEERIPTGTPFEALLQVQDDRLMWIQSSEDLVQWRDWFSTRAVDGSIRIPMSPRADQPRRFVRAVAP